MEIIKNKMTILLIILVLGASYIGGLENSCVKDNSNPKNQVSSINM